ncbi:MAG TPA: YcxB family protein [Pirellulales bacterium]
MEDSVFVEFDNELADHLRAGRLYYKSTFWAKGDRFVAILLVVGGAILTVVGHWWALLLIPLAVAKWLYLLPPSEFVLFFKRNPKFLETYHLSFSENGIHFKTESIDSTIAWSHYNKVLEDQNVILLIYGSRMYTVIPKRVFSDASQLKAFREIVARQIGAVCNCSGSGRY